jgi:hypothetical protein
MLSRPGRPGWTCLEVAPGELGFEYRTEVSRRWYGTRDKLVDTHQHAGDNHAEALRKAERDAVRTSVLSLYDQVARHLEETAYSGEFDQLPSGACFLQDGLPGGEREALCLRATN